MWNAEFNKEELDTTDSSNDDKEIQLPEGGWHSVENATAAESAPYENSQMDVLQEMRAHPFELETQKHSYQLSYELALDNMLTPFASASNQSFGKTYTTHAEHVIMELVSTEQSYVEDLTDIVEGYVSPLEVRVGTFELSNTDIVHLFGNVRRIKSFNWSVLHILKSCGESSKKVGECFIQKAEGFKENYSEYCNNYPNAIQMLSKLEQDPSISHFLKICQQRLNHMLPLGAYLLKPVQRVLKYSLLLSVTFLCLYWK
jgi:hypothetical protein